jgi:heptaprenyl diphosphate synthase
VVTELHETVAEVEADLAALAARLGTAPDTVDRAMSRFIDTIVGRARAGGSNSTIEIMVRFPLLVHAAEAGSPAGGKSAGLVHLLWWTAARYLDDLADADPGARPDRLAESSGILTAIATGCHLPARLFAAAQVADTTRAHLAAEVSRAWLDGISGQLMDYTVRPADATPEAVLDSYRGKTGAPYGMASALAARLAGADDRRTDGWRDVGRQFGVLRQIVNDRKDLATGRDEDLKNGTTTYLLAYVLNALPGQLREEMLALHTAAVDSPAARAELRRQMLTTDAVAGYTRAVDSLVADLHRSLDELGGVPPYPARLHALVDEAMDVFPLPSA